MKKWKHTLCLLLCAAILLCACGKTKSHDTTYDYLLENISKATVLPNGGFATFSEVKEVNDAALTQIPLPQGVDSWTKPQKIDDKWFLIDVNYFSDQYHWPQDQSIYFLQDGKWVELFDKTMHPLYSETREGVPHEIAINLRHVYDNKLFFEINVISNNLGPRHYALYGVDLKTRKFFTAYEEKTCGRITPFVFVDGSAYVQNCDIDDSRIILDCVRIDLDDLKVVRFDTVEQVTDKHGKEVMPFEGEQPSAPLSDSENSTYIVETLTAKQVNDLHDKWDKVKNEAIFPPENEASLNRVVANVLTRQGTEDAFAYPILLPVENNENSASCFMECGENAVIMSTTNMPNQNKLLQVMVYNSESDTIYQVAKERQVGYPQIGTFFTENEFAFALDGQFTIIDLTKV